MDSDDIHLLLRMHDGDGAAADLVWRRHAPSLRAYARSIVREDSAAEDVVQRVFCRVLELPKARLRAIDAARPWLAAAVRNEAIRHLRGEGRERRRRDNAAKAGALRSVPQPAEAHWRTPDSIEAALESLPRRSREALVLRHIAGLNFDQMAAALGLPRSTVASRYTAAVALIRAAMTPRPLGTPRKSPEEVRHAC